MWPSPPLIPSFNPSVGILGVQASGLSRYRYGKAKFQSLGRDSGCSSSSAECDRRFIQLFQSLGRDSGCSSLQSPVATATWPMFQSLGRDSGCSSCLGCAQADDVRVVSIPRSGFWVFKLLHRFLPRDIIPSFNPSVGILGVQASQFSFPDRSFSGFQSLGRDSGCSSFSLLGLLVSGSVVSIPRSGFWVFKQVGIAVGACGVGSFNPSVGILGVQACTTVITICNIQMFQSLGRDSGCSS